MEVPYLYDGYEPFTEEEYFNCGAVELAKKLLGRYLYGPQSDIMIRIIETEAYPHGDAVYDRILGGVSESFPNKAGVVLRLSSGLHTIPTKCEVVNAEHLYITAGGTEGSRDVVLLRCCEPHIPEITYVQKIEGLLGYNAKTTDYERKIFLMGPQFVAKALANDRESNPVLYEACGYQLCKNKALDHPLNPEYILREPTKYGKRVLAKSKFCGPCLGSENKLRFALHIEKYYIYEQWIELDFMPL